MGLRTNIRSFLLKYAMRGTLSYEGDALALWNKNLDFLTDPKFVSAYRRGMDSGHTIGRPMGSKKDIHIEYRVYICCWAAAHAAKLPGNFAECGTNTGIMSLAICEYIDFNATGKDFFLFDTYNGIPESALSERDRAANRISHNKMYFDCYEVAKKNFSPFPKAHLVRGVVPESFHQVDTGPISYLCLDMNIAKPERAAIEHFWPKMVTGGIVILDDYGWNGYKDQKETIDEFATLAGVKVLTLPTGQGMMIKP
ncbi:MAG: TylF/MycF/NovP-related O-methyltransferase [Xanthobacteraceae bacterium]|jgi:O-methyltransferase